MEWIPLTYTGHPWNSWQIWTSRNTAILDLKGQRVKWKRLFTTPPKSPKARKSDNTTQLQMCATCHKKNRMTQTAMSPECRTAPPIQETSFLSLGLVIHLFLPFFSHFEWEYLPLLLFLPYHCISETACLPVSQVHRWKRRLIQDELLPTPFPDTI